MASGLRSRRRSGRIGSVSIVRRALPGKTMPGRRLLSKPRAIASSAPAKLSSVSHRELNQNMPYSARRLRSRHRSLMSDASSVSYRSFTMADMDALVRADEELTIDLLGTFDECYGRSWLLARLHPSRSSYLNWSCIVAEKDAAPIGFVIFFHHSKGCRHRDPSKRAFVDFVELFFLSVDKSARRRGIGAALVKAVKSYAQSVAAQEVRLHVLERNIGALRLYRSMGFEQLMLKNNYPCPNANSWRMRWYCP